VSTNPSNSPVFSSHAVAVFCQKARRASRPSGVEVSKTAARAASTSGSARQSKGWDCPTPRGSKPTTSYAPSTAGLNTRFTESMKATPEPPGPPGFVTSEPMRLSWSAAGRRFTAREIVAPVGSLWSIGTSTRAHS